jgi:hypothetical protein
MDSNNKVDTPSEITFGSGALRTHFTRKRGFYAIHNWTGKRTTGGPEFVLDDAAIFRGDASDSNDRKEGPVYEVQPAGTAAVPTGRVFVRFRESIDAGSREKAIRKAGYRIVKLPPWAPHTVWVEAASGTIADSLRNLNELQALDDIEHVEPQMLMPAATRA